MLSEIIQRKTNTLGTTHRENLKYIAEQKQTHRAKKLVVTSRKRGWGKSKTEMRGRNCCV